MAIQALSPREQKIILQCMSAAAMLIDESETHSRMGVSRQKLQAVIAQWPDIDDGRKDSNAFLAINNSLTEICDGLRIENRAELFDCTPDEVICTYRNWLGIHGIHGGD